MRGSGRRFGSPVGFAVGALVLMAASALMSASALAAAPRYAELRQLDPVHGDAAAGAKRRPCALPAMGRTGYP
jgi:hypothetical protein